MLPILISIFVSIDVGERKPDSLSFAAKLYTVPVNIDINEITSRDIFAFISTIERKCGKLGYA